MTVHYLNDVLTSRPGLFLWLLLRWRGGIHKLLFIELSIFLILFYSLNMAFRFLMPEADKRNFMITLKKIFDFQSKIPIILLLGFYIYSVYNNFINRFKQIPWIMTVATLLSFYLNGENQEKEILIRRAIMRYMSTALIMTIIRVHRHNLLIDDNSLVKAGFLTVDETEMIKAIPSAHAHPFIPICWALSLVSEANKNHMIFNSFGFANIVEAMNDYRKGLMEIILSDEWSYPLIYTQVNTLAVYMYFVFSLISSQKTTYNDIDIYFPVGAVLEFIVFVGLLKCAIGMLNPMGDDEENFELDEIILYNWMVCGCIDSTLVHNAPERPDKDFHWDNENIRLETSSKCHFNLNG